MKEKLIIKNFGPIKEVELELGKFNVLIGEQATGKSTVAKVLAVCRYFSYIVQSDAESLKWHGMNFLNGLNAWGLDEFILNDTFIYYECRHYSLSADITVVKDAQKEYGVIGFSVPDITLNPLSQEFKNLLTELESIKPKSSEIQNSRWVIPTSFFQNDVAAVMDNPFYVPTERVLQSLFSLGQNSIPNISNSLYNYFDKSYFIASNHFKRETAIEPLDIVYKNENGKGLVKSPRHDFINLVNAADGYQSAIPIVLITKYYCDVLNKRKTFIIEEPEISLFPSAQNKLMQYLAYKTINYGNTILITTHSPYILTSLNNLMYAFKVGNENDKKNKEAVANVIGEKYWIDPEDVSAYILKYDEEQKGIIQEKIIDKEGLIKVQKIDEVSSILNREFNAIMNIELNIGHEVNS